MSNDALTILNGAVHPTVSPLIPAARELVATANEVSCVVGKLWPGGNLANIYKARRDRMAKAGQPIPKGMEQAIEAFARVGESLLSTCYIKADNQLVYFWRDASDVIVALILWAGDGSSLEDALPKS